MKFSALRKMIPHLIPAGMVHRHVRFNPALLIDTKFENGERVQMTMDGIRRGVISAGTARYDLSCVTYLRVID